MKFFEWVIQHHYGKPTPLGDLAEDMAFDVYTGPNTQTGILTHLNRCGADPACIEVFKTAWDQYQQATDRDKPTTMPKITGLNQHATPLIGTWQDSKNLAGFLDLDKPEQRCLLEWIENQLWVGPKWNMNHTSYGLKHLFTRACGIYVTNAAFKDAMVLGGFPPRWAGRLNHHYRIHPLSPALGKPPSIANLRVLPRRRDTRR